MLAKKKTVKHRVAQPKAKKSRLAIIVASLSLIAGGMGQMENIVNFGKSIYHGMPFSRIKKATHDNEMFRKNFKCVQTKPYILARGEVTYKIYFCNSGDVLFEIAAPGHSALQSGFHWIDSKLFKKTARLFSFTELHAATKRRIPISTVLCYRWIDEIRILRRVMINKGRKRKCFDEIINTYTMAIESRMQSVCDNDC